MKQALTILLALASSLTNAIPMAVDPFKPLVSRATDRITINSVSASGTGCGSGTWTQEISPDQTVLTVGFIAMQTYIGPGTTVAQRTRECLLTLSLNYPGGSSSTVVDTTYHGFAQLPTGVTGTFTPTFGFALGSPSSGGSPTSISGGNTWVNGRGYTKVDIINHSASGVSGCSRNANLSVRIKLQLSATSSSLAGSFAADDVTIALTSQTHSGGC